MTVLEKKERRIFGSCRKEVTGHWKKKYMITGFVKEDETEHGARRELYLFTFYCIPEQQNGMLKYEMIKLAKQ